MSPDTNASSGTCWRARRYRCGPVRRRRRRIHQAADSRAFRNLPDAGLTARRSRVDQERTWPMRIWWVWYAGGGRWPPGPSSKTPDGCGQFKQARGFPNFVRLSSRCACSSGEECARMASGSHGPRVYLKGFGTVVTGTLISGTVKSEEEVELYPAGRRLAGSRSAGLR